MSRFWMPAFLLLTVLATACSIHLPAPTNSSSDAAGPSSSPLSDDGTVYGIALRCLSGVSGASSSLGYQVQYSPMMSATNDSDLRLKLQAWSAANCPSTFDLSSFPSWQGCTLHAFPGGFMSSTNPQEVLSFQGAHPEDCAASPQSLYGTPQCN